MLSEAGAVIKAGAAPGTASDKKMDELSVQVQHLNLEQLEAMLEDFLIYVTF